MELATSGHEVWVLTWPEFRQAIDAELEKLALPNLRFVYYTLPTWLAWWQQGQRGIRLYYVLWQWGAYQLAKRLHAREQFDLVQHLTLGAIRHASFMGRLGIPFLFGPVGGGEHAPWRLRRGYSLLAKIGDLARDLTNGWVRYDPLMRQTFRQAQWIVATSQQTQALIPQRFWEKVQIQLAIGITSQIATRPERRQPHQPFSLIYVGRFLEWKGMHLGLAAFAMVLQQLPDARLTLVGQGPAEKRWHHLAETLGIAAQLDWISWVNQKDLAALYARHDLLLFPSLHDSGGMVVLEAMSHGLPVVCLDIGGPGRMVNALCGRVIATAGMKEADVIRQLGNAILLLANQPEYWEKLSQGAFQRVQEFSWPKVVRAF